MVREHDRAGNEGVVARDLAVLLDHHVDAALDLFSARDRVRQKTRTDRDRMGLVDRRDTPRDLERRVRVSRVE